MQILFNGAIQGLLFALMAMSFSLVYGTTRTFHVALGGIFTLSPYVLWACLGAGFGWPAGLVVAVIVACAVGLLCEELIHWPLARKAAPPDIHLIASLGALLVIVQVVIIIWGADSQFFQLRIAQVVEFAGIRLTYPQVAVAIASSGVIAGFFFWLARSAIGLQFRAMADNPVLLSLLGRNVRRLRRMIFIGSAGLAALAAIGTAHDVGFDPHGGLKAVLVGMAATIIGGRTSIAGAAMVGFGLGVMRQLVVWYTSAQWEDALTFVLLALVLFAKPEGLFGGKLRLEERA